MHFRHNLSVKQIDNAVGIRGIMSRVSHHYK